MDLIKKVVKKGTQIGRDWTDSTRGAQTADDKESSTRAALSNKHLLVDRISQVLQFYNEKELKTHFDVLRSDEKDSFYSLLLVEQQHYYEGLLCKELDMIKELKSKLLKKISEVEGQNSRSQSNKDETNDVVFDY